MRYNWRTFDAMLLNNKDQQVLVVSCSPRAKSAIYDFPVLTVSFMILQVQAEYSATRHRGCDANNHQLLDSWGGYSACKSWARVSRSLLTFSKYWDSGSSVSLYGQ